MADPSEVVGAPGGSRERYVAPMIEVLGTVQDTLGIKPAGVADEGLSFGDPVGPAG